MTAGKGSKQRPTDKQKFDESFDRIFGRPSCCEHDSDCAVHNEPAYPAGPCDCSVKGEQMRQIYYWADGTWCDLQDYPGYSHMSDVVASILVSFDYTDDEVDRLIQAALLCKS